MTHQGENMAEVVVTPAVRVPSEERRYVGRAWYILSSLAATLCSALVVGSAVQNVDELFGYVPPLFLLLLPTAGLGIGIMWSTDHAQNHLAHLSSLAFPTMTLLWCRLALRMPGTVYRAEPDIGPIYSEIGSSGVVIVMASMAATMAALWVLGDRRIRWRVRIPVVLAVFAVHVPLVVWLMGRPSA